MVGAKGACSSLETIWKCFITITKAIARVGKLEWALGKKPADSEVIAVYGGKSAFYEQGKVLQRVKLFPPWLSGWSDLIWMRKKLLTFGVITN